MSISSFAKPDTAFRVIISSEYRRSSPADQSRYRSSSRTLLNRRPVGFVEGVPDSPTPAYGPGHAGHSDTNKCINSDQSASPKIPEARKTEERQSILSMKPIGQNSSCAWSSQSFAQNNIAGSRVSSCHPGLALGGTWVHLQYIHRPGLDSAE